MANNGDNSQAKVYSSALNYLLIPPPVAFTLAYEFNPYIPYIPHDVSSIIQLRWTSLRDCLFAHPQLPTSLNVVILPSLEPAPLETNITQIGNGIRPQLQVVREDEEDSVSGIDRGSALERGWLSFQLGERPCSSGWFFEES